MSKKEAPHRPESFHLGAHPVRAPAPLYGQLGMARIFEKLAQIHHHHVELPPLRVVDGALETFFSLNVMLFIWAGIISCFLDFGSTRPTSVIFSRIGL